MRIGLIDVDGHNFPNLALMKISAWHKAQGDEVEWYAPLLATEPLDKVYMSKVFTFTPDFEWAINAKQIVKKWSDEMSNGISVRLIPDFEKAFKEMR